MPRFKTITLELYNQEVKVTFKEGTESIKKYGQFIVGKLVGRVWGERFDQDHSVSTVIGIILKTPTDDELNLASSEIENIERAIV